MGQQSAPSIHRERYCERSNVGYAGGVCPPSAAASPIGPDPRKEHTCFLFSTGKLAGLHALEDVRTSAGNTGGQVVGVIALSRYYIVRATTPIPYSSIPRQWLCNLSPRSSVEPHLYLLVKLERVMA